MAEKLTSHDIAKMIDHSLLHPTLTDAQLIAGCEVAKKYDVASCCVKPYHTKLAADCLKGSTVLVCTVVNFPHGNNPTALKVIETEAVIKEGATEIDLVANIGKICQGDWAYVENDLGEVSKVCKKHGAKLKVIFGVDFLNDEQIAKVTQICNKVKADWVKTSTGYNYIQDKNGAPVYYGATDRVLKIMADNVAPGVQVKAAGKCRTLERVIEIREKFGVTRVGAGNTAEIMEAAREKLDGAGPAKKVDASISTY
ncbi:MAG: deoxyribose-phosphate aldolase [Kiritimatiellaceae bacterium]|nr:deoxyribose-phosphate aldolase [Kiritimatiellaceae bacterium]